jgi:hypothetical protein
MFNTSLDTRGSDTPCEYGLVSNTSLQHTLVLNTPRQHRIVLNTTHKHRLVCKAPRQHRHVSNTPHNMSRTPRQVPKSNFHTICIGLQVGVHSVIDCDE